MDIRKFWIISIDDKYSHSVTNYIRGTYFACISELLVKIFSEISISSEEIIPLEFFSTPDLKPFQMDWNIIRFFKSKFGGWWQKNVNQSIQFHSYLHFIIESYVIDEWWSCRYKRDKNDTFQTKMCQVEHHVSLAKETL